MHLDCSMTKMRFKEICIIRSLRYASFLKKFLTVIQLFRHLFITQHQSTHILTPKILSSLTEYYLHHIYSELE